METLTVSAHRRDGSAWQPVVVQLDLDKHSCFVQLRTAPAGPELRLSSSDARILGDMLVELGVRACYTSDSAPNRFPRITLGDTRWVIDETNEELICEDDPSRHVRYGIGAN
jgi:hypothetical protein